LCKETCSESIDADRILRSTEVYRLIFSEVYVVGSLRKDTVGEDSWLLWGLYARGYKPAHE